MCLGGRVCAPERGWEAGLATSSASESFSSRPPHPHSPPSRPQTGSHGLAANFGRWGKEGRRWEEPPVPRSFPLLSPGTEIKISKIILCLLLRLSREKSSSPSAVSLERERNPIVHIGESQVAPHQPSPAQCSPGLRKN